MNSLGAFVWDYSDCFFNFNCIFFHQVAKFAWNMEDEIDFQSTLEPDVIINDGSVSGEFFKCLLLLYAVPYY